MIVEKSQYSNGFEDSYSINKFKVKKTQISANLLVLRHFEQFENQKTHSKNHKTPL